MYPWQLNTIWSLERITFLILFGFKAPLPTVSTDVATDAAFLLIVCSTGQGPHDKDHAHWDNLMLFLGNFSPQIDPFELVKLARKHYFPLHSPK